MVSARERRERIVEMAAATGAADVETIAAHFNVSASTVRRDLAHLGGSGRLTRTYGGAIAPNRVMESSFAARSVEAHQQKYAIASWATAQIQPSNVVLIDAGSTAALVARALPTDHDLTVATASLAALNQMHGRPDIEVHCLGGRLRASSDAFIGPATEAALERLTFDIAFLGADSVTARGELCEADPEQTRLKELMARRSSKVFVLAHAEKLNRRAYNFSAPLSRDQLTVVTDDSVSSDTLAAFRAEGVRVVVTSVQASDDASTVGWLAQAL